MPYTKLHNAPITYLAPRLHGGYAPSEYKEEDDVLEHLQ